MKTNVTLPVLLLIIQPAFAQPDYSFKNPTRLSGPNLQQGAVYLFARIAINAQEDGWASFEVVDYSGRSALQRQLVINKGQNEISFFNTSSITSGNYVALLEIDGIIYNQKNFKQ